MTAVETLVRDNLDIARREARRWLHYRVIEQEDLVSEGALGLVKAAQSFDPARGVPFRAYATIRVRGAVTDAVRARVRKARDANGEYVWTYSLDAPVVDDGRTRKIPDSGASVEEQVIAREAVRGLAGLPEREAEALVRSVVFGDTLEEIGRDLGVSAIRAGQLADRGVARLKAAVG